MADAGLLTPHRSLGFADEALSASMSVAWIATAAQRQRHCACFKAAAASKQHLLQGLPGQAGVLHQVLLHLLQHIMALTAVKRRGKGGKRNEGPLSLTQPPLAIPHPYSQDPPAHSHHMRLKALPVRPPCYHAGYCQAETPRWLEAHVPA